MISVCMASFNGEKYIAKQIVSILHQLASEDELIISDDGSSDNTVDIILGFEDARIKLISNDLGDKFLKNHYLVTSNFHNALTVATGEYIFLVDQDDIWHCNRINSCIPLLNEFDLILCNCSIIDSEGNLQGYNLWSSNPISRFFLTNLIRMQFHGCCIAFHKRILNVVLPFPPMLISHDNWIGLLTTITGKVVYLDEPLVFYRRHSTNVSLLDKSLNNFSFKVIYRLRLAFQVFRRIIHIKILNKLFFFDNDNPV